MDQPLFTDAMRELSSIISAADAPKAIRDGFLRLLDAKAKLITIKAHPQTAIVGGACDCSLRFEASDFLVRLLAAARARNWEKVMVLEHEALTPVTLASAG